MGDNKLYFILDDKTGKKEPTIRLLYETIVTDLVQGARFYDFETLNEYDNPRDILLMFIMQKNMYIRVPSECEKLNNLTIQEFLEFCKINEFNLTCDCNDPTKCRTAKNKDIKTWSLN